MIGILSTMLHDNLHEILNKGIANIMLKLQGKPINDIEIDEFNQIQHILPLDRLNDDNNNIDIVFVDPRFFPSESSYKGSGVVTDPDPAYYYEKLGITDWIGKDILDPGKKPFTKIVNDSTFNSIINLYFFQKLKKSLF